MADTGITITGRHDGSDERDSEELEEIDFALRYLHLHRSHEVEKEHQDILR